MKVVIVYDRVNKFGGAEKVLLALHTMFPKADLYTSVYSKEKAKWANVFPKIKTSFLQYIPFAKDNHEFFFFLMPLAFSLFNFDKYDLVISVTSEFAKNINVKNIHICYCLTPTRYLWSHNNEYFKNKYIKFFLKPVINYLKYTDYKASRKPNEIIAISTTVQSRIKKYYGRKSRIIFPPVEVKKALVFKTSDKQYYLIVSRLVNYKRIDLAIEVFNKLNKPLVIVGTGREMGRLRRSANENIKFAGFIGEKELSKYYLNAKALIFPQEEDFGITSVEAQAYGIPVIAYKGGGAIDTIVPNKTGIFFDKQNTKSLIKAVEKFERTNFVKKDLIKNSKKFSSQKFKKEFLALINGL